MFMFGYNEILALSFFGSAFLVVYSIVVLGLLCNWIIKSDYCLDGESFVFGGVPFLVGSGLMTWAGVSLGFIPLLYVFIGVSAVGVLISLGLWFLFDFEAVGAIPLLVVLCLMGWVGLRNQEAIFDDKTQVSEVQELHVSGLQTPRPVVESQDPVSVSSPTDGASVVIPDKEIIRFVEDHVPESENSFKYLRSLRIEKIKQVEEVEDKGKELNISVKEEPEYFALQKDLRGLTDLKETLDKEVTILITLNQKTELFPDSTRLKEDYEAKRDEFILFTGNVLTLLQSEYGTNEKEEASGGSFFDRLKRK
jgi:hypothetical protein